MIDCSRPEGASDHRAALEHDLRSCRQPVDARADHRLERVGDAIAALGSLLHEHPHRLLHEEGVALGLVEQACAHLPRHPVFFEQRICKCLAVFAPERFELDRGRAYSPASPPRPHVEQFRARKAEDQERTLAHPLREMVDQLEQGLLGPVDVLEDHDQRLHVGQLVGELPRGPRDFGRTPFAFDRLHHAGRETEQLGDRLVAATLDQLLLCRFHRIVVRDSGGRLDHLGQRPVRHALAVGQRATGEDRGALDSREEFPDQTALANARLPVDSEDVRAPVANRACQGVLEQIEFRLAADEGS